MNDSLASLVETRWLSGVGRFAVRLNPQWRLKERKSARSR